MQLVHTEEIVSLLSAPTAHGYQCGSAGLAGHRTSPIRIALSVLEAIQAVPLAG